MLEIGGFLEIVCKPPFLPQSYIGTTLPKQANSLGWGCALASPNPGLWWVDLKKT